MSALGIVPRHCSKQRRDLLVAHVLEPLLPLRALRASATLDPSAMRIPDRVVEVHQRLRQPAWAVPLGDAHQRRLDVHVPVVAPALPAGEPAEVRHVRSAAGKQLVEALELLLGSWLKNAVDLAQRSAAVFLRARGSRTVYCAVILPFFWIWIW